jgi:hypothetical protein
VQIIDPGAPPRIATAIALERMRVKTRCTWRIKPSPAKSLKTTGEKRSREEAAGSAAGSTPPVSPPRPNPNKEWKKSKAKTEDLLALLNNGFLREKEVDMWRAAVADPYPMERNPDVHAVRGARVSSPGEQLLQGAFGVLWYQVPQSQP